MVRQSPRLTGFAGSSTLPAIMKTEAAARLEGPNHMVRSHHPIDNAAILEMIDRLKELYQSFPWESRVWVKDGYRRSPYRTLILFGLSARTKDRLLVQMCEGFFRSFPETGHLLHGWLDGDLDSIVRMGQISFIESAVQVIRNHGGVIPADKDGLMQIKGVGEKIAECVIAYGWGGEALPLDGNGCRVVERVSGACSVQVLRGSLKELYCRCRSWMEDRGLAMVDLHELIRLHGQMVCTKVPKCSICPVSTCRSRRVEHQTGRFPAISPEIWQDWRELLLEPTSSKGS